MMERKPFMTLFAEMAISMGLTLNASEAMIYYKHLKGLEFIEEVFKIAIDRPFTRSGIASNGKTSDSPRLPTVNELRWIHRSIESDMASDRQHEGLLLEWSSMEKKREEESRQMEHFLLDFKMYLSRSEKIPMKDILGRGISIPSELLEDLKNNKIAVFEELKLQFIQSERGGT